jgi:hypothetical protein
MLGRGQSRFARSYGTHGKLARAMLLATADGVQAYPESGTFESQGPCPASHPVRVPQVMFEVIYETKEFNDPTLWPEDGSQPFVYSFGDATGYANHGDYLFGWKDDSLQKIMDEECFVNCSSMRTQSIEQMNACSTTRKVDEDVGDSNCKSNDTRRVEWRTDLE